VFGKYLTGNQKPIAVAVDVVDGSVLLNNNRSGQSWQVEKFNLQFALPADRSAPWTLKTTGVLANAERNGAFDLAMQVQQATQDNDAVVDASLVALTEGAAEPSSPDSLDLKAEGISLAAFNSLLGRAAPGSHLAGRLSGAVHYRCNSRQPHSRAALKGNILGEDLAMAGPRRHPVRIEPRVGPSEDVLVRTPRRWVQRHGKDVLLILISRQSVG